MTRQCDRAIALKFGVMSTMPTIAQFGYWCRSHGTVMALTLLRTCE